MWLVEATFDEYGLSTTTKRYADSAFTLSSNVHNDILADSGLRLSMSNLNSRGGFAAISGFSVVIRDELGESDIADTHVLSNDSVVVYCVFKDGTEVTADRIEIARGVLESNRAEGDEWHWRVKDGSRKLLRSFPTERLDPIRYPYAFEPGQVFPMAFGNMNVGPDSGTGSAPALAPMRMTDRFSLKASAGELSKTAGQPYQYYSQAQRIGKITTYSVASNNETTINDPARTMTLPAVRPKTSNNIAGYRLAIDGNTSTSVSVGTSDSLDLWFSGCPKLGELTSISVKVSADAGDSWTYTVYKDTTSKATATVTGDATIALTATDYDDWSMGLLNIEINGSGGEALIENVKVEIGFDDFLALSDQAPSLWQECVGFEDLTSHYYDGSVVKGAAQALRNPIDQIEALLRAKQANGIAQAGIGAGFPDAVTSRANFYLDWAIKDSQDEQVLHDIGELVGVHIWPDGDGFNVSVNEKTRLATSFFHGDFHMPVKNAQSHPSEWEYDFRVAPVDSSDITNEFALRYGINGATGEYRKSVIASGQFRISGTDARLDSSAATLTAASATFQTDSVVAGETVYVGTDIAYTVVAVVSETVLTITPISGAGVSEITTNADYWLGPNLRAECLLSQLSFKTINALGTAQETLLDDGGFKTPYVQDDATAALIVDYMVEWFAYPRDRVSFSVFHSAINVEKGDVLFLDHPELFGSKKAPELSTANGAHSNSVTTITPADNLFRNGDYVYFLAADGTPEVMLVTGVNYSGGTFTVARAKCNTQAQAIPNNAPLYRLTVKWMVTGIEPMTWDSPAIGVEAEQMPSDYKPVGIVVAASYPVYGSATAEQIAASGWSTLRSGRIIDLDNTSNVSYSGADSGTYTIDAVP